MTAVDVSRYTVLQLWVIVNNAPTDLRLWTPLEVAAELEIIRREQEMAA